MVMVLTPDLAEAEPFYRDVLGLVLTDRTSRQLVFDLAGTALRVVQCAEPAEAHRHAASASTICVFEAPSIDAEMSRMRALGVTFIHDAPSQDESGFRYAAFRAPGGNVHELMEWRAEPDTSRS
jgi:catechol 2,3-dioxygenase-like lactoylglutathione lyase family enzyme